VVFCLQTFPVSSVFIELESNTQQAAQTAGAETGGEQGQ
jgi:hypothetical protein